MTASPTPSGQPGRRAGLSLVHWGSFSGTLQMMVEPLARHANVEYHDITPLTRAPRLLWARAAAQLESRRQDFAWHKTAGWSAAVQDYAMSHAWIRDDVPTLFYQTLPAPVLDARFRYAIYADRVAREGAMGKEDFRSTWGPGWIDREHEFLTRASAIFVMGPSTERVLIDLYGIDGDRIHLVGAGPGSRLGPVQETIREPRRLLFVGTNWRLKGGPEVLEAFERVGSRHSDLELVLVGDEPDRPLPERTRSLGRVPREAMPGLFAESDIFVVPTYMEALGYSLLEALMHGLPAIGSKVGNQAWVIGEAGLTVDPGEVEQLEGAIERVLAEYPTFKDSALANALRLRHEMSWERVADEIAEVFLDERRTTPGEPSS